MEIGGLDVVEIELSLVLKVSKGFGDGSVFGELLVVVQWLVGIHLSFDEVGFFMYLL